MGDSTADRASAASLVVLLALYYAALQRRRPIPTRRQAAEIGASWAALTVAFEFVFGHWIDGKSWRKLLDDYGVTKGNPWPAVLLWVGVGPAVVREISSGR